MSQKIAVCVLSGGLDSAVASAIANNSGYSLHCIFFNYGQKALDKELSCFRRLCEHFAATDTREVQLEWWKQIGGTVLLKDAPLLTPENEPLEYVPFRNALFLSYALSWCEVLRGDAIFFGSTLGAMNCPDNTPEFFNAFQKLICTGTKYGQSIKVEVPLLQMTKADVVRAGSELGVPFEYTWSCLNDEGSECGVCSNCRMRQEAFQDAGFLDPSIGC